MLVSVLKTTVAVAAVVAPVVALAEDSVPRQPSLTRSAPAWVGFLLMVILLTIVLGVSLMPSKRGHQD